MDTGLEKSYPPLIENDQSTKKAKFKTQGVDGDNPPSGSFKDKLLETQIAVEEEFMSKEEDIEIDMGDVVVETEGLLLAISFFLESSFTTSETMANNSSCEITKKIYKNKILLIEN